MKKRVYIFINGILTWPGASNNWNSKAVTHFISRLGHYAEVLEYFTLPTFSRVIGQEGRAAKLRKKLQHYINAGFEIVLVGHSNGGDVILDTLRDMDWPRVEEIHFISPACDADFVKNGLNEALRENNVGQVFVGIADRDFWLKVAGTLVGMAFGYGQLGRTGPMRVCEDIACRIHVHHEPDFGHSEWFEDENFVDTMNRVVKMAA